MKHGSVTGLQAREPRLRQACVGARVAEAEWEDLLYEDDNHGEGGEWGEADRLRMGEWKDIFRGDSCKLQRAAQHHCVTLELAAATSS